MYVNNPTEIWWKCLSACCPAGYPQDNQDFNWRRFGVKLVPRRKAPAWTSLHRKWRQQWQSYRCSFKLQPNGGCHRGRGESVFVYKNNNLLEGSSAGLGYCPPPCRITYVSGAEPERQFSCALLGGVCIVSQGTEADRRKQWLKFLLFLSFGGPKQAFMKWRAGCRVWSVE